MKFHFNRKEVLTSINGNTISIAKVDTKADISATKAGNIAKDFVTIQDLNKSNTALEIVKTTLLIFPKNLAQGGFVTNYITYEIEITN